MVLSVFALPASMGVAILKYRLYDIDRVISRTLAYAIVTGLLVGFYAGLGAAGDPGAPVPRIGGGGRRHAGGGGAVQPGAAAGAAGGGPPVQPGQVRRRPAVAAFAARLQDAVELDAIREDLAGAVQSALEPAHVWVWTSPPE